MPFHFGFLFCRGGIKAQTNRYACVHFCLGDKEVKRGSQRIKRSALLRSDTCFSTRRRCSGFPLQHHLTPKLRPSRCIEGVKNTTVFSNSGPPTGFPLPTRTPVLSPCDDLKKAIVGGSGPGRGRRRTAEATVGACCGLGAGD